jgi:SAM-dependent methyltransferase
MADNPSACRLCGGRRLACLGVLPASDYFAGRVLPEVLPGGRLWRCGDCDSMFRHPTLSSSRYRELYESGAPEQWHGDSGRRDLQVVSSLILRHAGAARILDVGCGAGDFLVSLPAGLSKFGIEPSVGAANEATRRGIRIVAQTLEELPADSRFDVITIIDVIEHVPDPALLLERAYAHLSDAGLIVVSTGDPQNVLWRSVFKARFWYSSFPEHVTFPSRLFFERWAADNAGRVVTTLSTPYRRLPQWKSAVYFLIQGVYLASPRLLDWTGRCFARLGLLPEPRRRHFAPGVGGLFADHRVVAIRRMQGADRQATRSRAS